MQYLDEQLVLGSVFEPQASRPADGLVADMVWSGADGSHVLVTIEFNNFNDANCVVMVDNVQWMACPTPAVETLDGYVVIVWRQGLQTMRGIFAQAALGQTISGRLVGRRCRAVPPGLRNLNGLTGDIRVTIDKYVTPVLSQGVVTLVGQDPRARYVCPENPCAAAVHTLNGISPDKSGLFEVTSDGCHSLMLDREGNLVWRNICDPCCVCEDVLDLNDLLVAQAQYMHQLSAMHQNQLNRLQAMVSIANQKACLSDVALGGGQVFITGRAIDRPYYNQLALGIVNATNWNLTVSLQCWVEDPTVASQFTTARGFIQHGFNTDANQQELMIQWPGFSPSGHEPKTLVIEPHRTATLSTELHRTSFALGAASTTNWIVHATILGVSPADPLNPGATLSQATVTAQRSYPLTVMAGL